MFDLIQNNYMRDYVKRRKDQDREEFLDNRVRAMKPIFRNYIDNNTNILRTDVGREKIKQMKEHELSEERI